jgi:hypothetical protein
VTDLEAAPAGPGTVTLSWSAPSDDSGRAVWYQVKRATLPIVPYEQFDFDHGRGKLRSWNFADNVTGEPPPSKPGMSETMTIEGLRPGTYWFAVRGYDASANQSGLSNPASVTVR